MRNIGLINRVIIKVSIRKNRRMDRIFIKKVHEGYNRQGNRYTSYSDGSFQYENTNGKLKTSGSNKSYKLRKHIFLHGNPRTFHR